MVSVFVKNHNSEVILVKKVRKLTALMLVFVMIISAVPLDVMADAIQSMNTASEIPNGTRIVIFPGHLYAAPSQTVLFFAALLNQDDEMVGVKRDVMWIVRENTSANTMIEEDGYLFICPYEESEKLYIVAISTCGENTYDTTTVTLTDVALSMGGPFLRVQGEDADFLFEAVMDEFFYDDALWHDQVDFYDFEEFYDFYGEVLPLLPQNEHFETLESLVASIEAASATLNILTIAMANDAGLPDLRALVDASYSGDSYQTIRVGHTTVTPVIAQDGIHQAVHWNPHPYDFCPVTLTHLPVAPRYELLWELYVPFDVALGAYDENGFSLLPRIPGNIPGVLTFGFRFVDRGVYILGAPPTQGSVGGQATVNTNAHGSFIRWRTNSGGPTGQLLSTAIDGIGVPDDELRVSFTSTLGTMHSSIREYEKLLRVHFAIGALPDDGSLPLPPDGPVNPLGCYPYCEFTMWSDWYEIAPPTCTTPGVRRRTETCIRPLCSETENHEYEYYPPPLPHDYVYLGWVITTPPSNNLPGERQRIVLCQRAGCDYERVETETFGFLLNHVQYTFTEATFGYGAQGAFPVTIENLGNQPTGLLTITSDNQAAFTVSPSTISYIAVGGNYVFRITPNTGLNAGLHTATITVSDTEHVSQEIIVSFLVNQAESDPEIPTGLIAVHGQVLMDVAFLPNWPNWTWDIPETSVGAVGSRAFWATYTPEDANFASARREVSITILHAPADAPLAAPTIVSGTLTSTSVTLSHGTATEFAISTTNTAPSTWQASPIFSDLQPGTTYFFFARYAQTATHSASLASPYASATTHWVLASITAPSETTIQRSDAIAGLWGLPDTVNIITTPLGGPATANIISWNTAAFNQGNLYAQYFSAIGTVVLPANVDNTNNIRLEVEVRINVAAHRYTVMWDLQNGDLPGVQPPTTAYHGTRFYGPQFDPVRAGYNFIGWLCITSGTSVSFPIIATRDTTFVAQWVEQVFGLSFNPSHHTFPAVTFGQTTSPSAITVTVENRGNLPVGELTIENDNPSAFTIAPFTLPGLSVHGSASSVDTFTVTTRTGLNAGWHTAILRVSGISGTDVVSREMEVRFFVEQAIREPSVIPNNLRAVFGQTLADVALPAGWAWNVPDTSVGAVGSRTFTATYTPNDTNYAAVERELTVTIGRRDQAPPSAPIVGVALTTTRIVLHHDTATLFGISTTSTPPSVWQTSREFDGLLSDTVYYFFARYAQTATHYESPPSSALRVSTLPANVIDLVITAQPTNLVYTHGEMLNLTGLTVRLTFDDYTVRDVAFGNFSAHGILTSFPNGEEIVHAIHNGQRIVVSVAGHSVETGTLTVNRAPQPAFAIVGESVLNLIVGDPAVTLETVGGIGDGITTWEVSPAGVVQVHPTTGELTILAVGGPVTVTAIRSGGTNHLDTTRTITVTVHSRMGEVLTITPHPLTIARGETEAFSVTVHDDRGVVVPNNNLQIRWELVGDVSSETRIGRYSGILEIDNNEVFRRQFSVRVHVRYYDPITGNPVELVGYAAVTVDFVAVDSITFEPPRLYLPSGGASRNISAIISPPANTNISNHDLTWTHENERRYVLDEPVYPLTFIEGSDNLSRTIVPGNIVGRTHIAVSLDYNPFSLPPSIAEVIVYSPVSSVVMDPYTQDMVRGVSSSTQQLTANFSNPCVFSDVPANGVRRIEWTTSNPAVATVNRYTGLVTLVGVGEVTIRATAHYGNLNDVDNGRNWPFAEANIRVVDGAENLHIVRDGLRIPGNVLVLPRETGAISLQGIISYVAPLPTPRLEWTIVHPVGTIPTDEVATITSMGERGHTGTLTILDNAGSAEIIVRAYCDIQGHIDETRLTLLVYTPITAVTVNRYGNGYLNVGEPDRVYIYEISPVCDFSDTHPDLRVITWRYDTMVRVNNEGEIEALSPGNATIYARVSHGENGYAQSNIINITILGDAHVFGIQIRNIDTYLREGEIRHLTLEYSGPARLHAERNGTRRWHSSDTSVVHVYPTGRIRVTGQTGQTARIYAYVELLQPGNPNWYVRSTPITITVIDPAPTVRITSTQTAFDATDPVSVTWTTTPINANPPLTVNVSVTRRVVTRVSRRILFFTVWNEEVTWHPLPASSINVQGNTVTFSGTVDPGTAETQYSVQVEVVNSRGDRSSTSQTVRVVDTGSWLINSPLDIGYLGYVADRNSEEIVNAWQSGRLTMIHDLRNRLSNGFHWRADDTLTWRIISPYTDSPIAQVQHWTSEGWIPLLPNQQVSHTARVRIVGMRNGTVQLEVRNMRLVEADLDGGTQIIPITVQTLPGSLHLIQTEPTLRDGYAIFTDINGIVHARPISGRLHAIYNIHGIHGYIDIVGTVSVTGTGGIPYFGAAHTGWLNSATHNSETPYTFNLIPLRRATQQRFIINTPNGQPFTGNVQVIGGALINRQNPRTLVFDDVTFSNGVLEITMNSSAFADIIDDVADAINQDSTREHLLEFVYELRFDGTPYAPELIFSRGIVSGRSHFNFNNTVVTLQEWDRSGFVDVRYLFDSRQYAENDNTSFIERWEDVTANTTYVASTTTWPNATLTTVLATLRSNNLTNMRHVWIEQNETVVEDYTNLRQFNWPFLSESPYTYFGLELTMSPEWEFPQTPPVDPPSLTIGIPQAQGRRYAIYGNFSTGNLQRLEMQMGVFNRIGMDLLWEDVDFTIDLSGAVTTTDDIGGAMGGGGDPTGPDAPIRGQGGPTNTGASSQSGAVATPVPVSSSNALVTRMLGRLMPAGSVDFIGFNVSYSPVPTNPLVYDVIGYWEKSWATSASRDFPGSPNRVYWSTGPGAVRLHNSRNCGALANVASGNIRSGSWDGGMEWFRNNRPGVSLSDLECGWNGGCRQKWAEWHRRIDQHEANMRRTSTHINEPPQVRGNIGAHASVSARASFRGEIGWCIHENQFVREVHELMLELTGAAGVSASMSLLPIIIPIPGLPVPPNVFGLRFTFNAGISMDIEAKVLIDFTSMASLRDMDWLSVTVRGNAYLSVRLAAHLCIWVAAASVGVRARIDFDAGFATYPLTWTVAPYRFDYVAGMLLHGTVGVDYEVRVGPRIRIFGRRLYRTWDGWIWRMNFPIWPRSGPANWCACGLGMNVLCNNDRCWDLYENVLLPEAVRPTRPVPPPSRNNLPGSAQAAGSSVRSAPPPSNLPTSGRQQPTDIPVAQGSNRFAAMAWVSGICETDIDLDATMSSDDFVDLASQTEITVQVMQNGTWGSPLTLDTTLGVASINPRVAVCEDSQRIIVMWEEMVFGVEETEHIVQYSGEHGDEVIIQTVETFTIEQRNLRFAKFYNGAWHQSRSLDIASISGYFHDIDIAINQWGAVVALSSVTEISNPIDANYSHASNVYLLHINSDGTSSRRVYNTSGSNMIGHVSVENFSDGFVFAYFTDVFGFVGDVVVRVLDPGGNPVPGLVNSLAAAAEMHGTLPTFDYQLIVRNHPTSIERVDEIVLVWVAFCMVNQMSVIHAAQLAPILDGEYLDLVFSAPITIDTRVGAGDDAVLTTLNAHLFDDTDGTLAVRVLYNRINAQEFASHETNRLEYNRLVYELENAADESHINTLISQLDAVQSDLDNPGSDALTVGRFENLVNYLVFLPNLDVVPGSWLTVELAVQNLGTSPMNLTMNLNGRTQCHVTNTSFSPSSPILPNEIYSWVVQVRVEEGQSRLDYRFIPSFGGGISHNQPHGYINFALPNVSLGTVAVTRSEDGQRDITIGYFSNNENPFPAGAMVHTFVYRDPLFSHRHDALTAQLTPFPANLVLGGGHSVTISYDVSGYLDRHPMRRVNIAPVGARVVMNEIPNERFNLELPHEGIPFFIRTEVRVGNQRVVESDFSRNATRVVLESMLRNNQDAITATVNRFNGQRAEITITNRSMQQADNVRFYARLYSDDNTVLEVVPIVIPVLGRESVAPHSVTFDGEGMRVSVTTEPPESPNWRWGDLNNNGVVDYADVTLLRRYIAGHPVIIHGNPDLNGDGVVNYADVTLLRRYIAGHPVGPNAP